MGETGSGPAQAAAGEIAKRTPSNSLVYHDSVLTVRQTARGFSIVRGAGDLFSSPVDSYAMAARQMLRRIGTPEALIAASVASGPLTTGNGRA